MSGVNKVILLGYVGRDPEIRRTQAGAAVAYLSLATSERWTDKATGEKREKTEWHNCVVFNEPLLKVVEQYVKKGSRIWVEGQNSTREWTDNNRIKRYVTEVVLQPFRSSIVLLDRAERAPDASEDAHSSGSSAPAPRPDIDDEIPF